MVLKVSFYFGLISQLGFKADLLSENKAYGLGHKTLKDSGHTQYYSGEKVNYSGG